MYEQLRSLSALPFGQKKMDIKKMTEDQGTLLLSCKQKILIATFCIAEMILDISHKLYLWHDILAGNLTLASIILLR